VGSFGAFDVRWWVRSAHFGRTTVGSFGAVGSPGSLRPAQSDLLGRARPWGWISWSHSDGPRWVRSAHFGRPAVGSFGAFWTARGGFVRRRHLPDRHHLVNRSDLDNHESPIGRPVPSIVRRRADSTVPKIESCPIAMKTQVAQNALYFPRPGMRRLILTRSVSEVMVWSPR
jgi:hypothetical protein